MSLEASIALERGTLRLDASFSVAPGELLALIGPNGAGKSTILRALAGLLPLDAGRIVLDGEVLDDPVAGILRPAADRPVGVVFQDYLLFPHLSVLENVAFGRRARGEDRHTARAAATAWLERVGLAEYARVRPGALSGGQAQRVALARALASDPRLLLLDEPLAALDAGTRAEVRRDLRTHLASFPGIRVLVTHDPLDAYALADRVAVVEGGQIVQAGTLPEVTAHPRSRYVAELLGINLLEGTVRHGIFRLPDGGELVVTGDAADGPAFAAVRPHAISLHTTEPGGSPRNVWRGVILDLDRLGDRVRVRVGGPVPLTAEVTAGAFAELGLEPGREVWTAVKATEIETYPA